MNPWERGEKIVFWRTTSDPRVYGRQGHIGETVVYRDLVTGIDTTLTLEGPTCTDWAEVTAGQGPQGDPGPPGPEETVLRTRSSSPGLLWRSHE